MKAVFETVRLKRTKIFNNLSKFGYKGGKSTKTQFTTKLHDYRDINSKITSSIVPFDNDDIDAYTF